ncbi:MAG: LysE family translocator [Rhizobiales bacterium]|nr:LysE family translocator [Hyphomicrobiales bacterium]
MSTVDLSNLLLAYLAFALMIISPGPNNMAVIATTVAYGRPAGTAVAFGISSGSFTWAVLTAAGLSAILAQTAGALMVIKIAGGLYLLWLAIKSLRAAVQGPGEINKAGPGHAENSRSHYLRGYILQMTNPKAALTWIAIISVGLNANANWPSLLLLIAGTSALAVIVHCSYAVLFSGQRVVAVFQGLHRWVHGFFAAFFGFAAFKLLTSRL